MTLKSTIQEPLTAQKAFDLVTQGKITHRERKIRTILEEIQKWAGKFGYDNMDLSRWDIDAEIILYFTDIGYNFFAIAKDSFNNDDKGNYQEHLDYLESLRKNNTSAKEINQEKAKYDYQKYLNGISSLYIYWGDFNKIVETAKMIAGNKCIIFMGTNTSDIEAQAYELRNFRSDINKNH